MELLHVVSAATWNADTVISPGPEGFLHCCTPAQLDFVLARHFPDATDLVVVRFESDHVDAELRWVRSEPDQDPFPHLYGPIPRSAVRRTEPR